MTIKQFFLWAFLLVSSNTLSAQQAGSDAPAKTPTIQPTIMVIPFVREDQDMRTILENDLNLRVAISKMKEGFDNRGVSTVDFRAKLKQLNNDKAMELGNQSSLKQEIIELSGADIYVETEAKVVRSPTGNSVTVIATAYDAFSGFSLANKVGNSPKFYTENFEKLTEKAVEGFVEDFLNTMQMKFDDIAINGRVSTLNISFAEDASMDMDTEVGDNQDLLSDALENWLEQHAYNSKFHVQGVTATKMIVDELRLPLRDADGRNYRVSKFAAELRNYLKSLGLESTRDIQGSKIFITIQ